MTKAVPGGTPVEGMAPEGRWKMSEGCGIHWGTGEAGEIGASAGKSQ